MFTKLTFTATLPALYPPANDTVVVVSTKECTHYMLQMGIEYVHIIKWSVEYLPLMLGQNKFLYMYYICTT